MAGANVEAAEEALVLARFAHTVHFISPKRQLQLDPHVAGELVDSPVVELHLGARARAVVGERRVEGLTLFHHGEERTLAVEGVFIYLQGGRPITELLFSDASVSSSFHLVGLSTSCLAASDGTGCAVRLGPLPIAPVAAQIEGLRAASLYLSPRSP